MLSCFYSIYTGNTNQQYYFQLPVGVTVHLIIQELLICTKRYNAITLAIPHKAEGQSLGAGGTPQHVAVLATV